MTYLLDTHLLIWVATGSKRLPRQVRGLIDHGYNELAITSEHGIRAGGLPRLHGDPFDRLLVAQAIAESVTLLTVDPVVARYAGPIWKM